jgi:hydroxypyruvate isomerase
MSTPANHPTRRSVLASAASVAAGAAVAGMVTQNTFAAESVPTGSAQLKGNIRQSVCKWCYDKIPLETLAAEGKKMGLVAIDLLGPESFDTLKKYGLVCSMTNSHPIHPGLNKKKNHEVCLAKMRDAIDATSAAGFKNIICFSGNREGQDDEEGMKVCAEALKQVVGLAEQKKVTICMELLNSKVNHKDYIGHIHTGGVPGRHEIDETQELYYPAIMKAIADIKFPGFVAQEFIPAREPIASLRQAVGICDV